MEIRHYRCGAVAAEAPELGWQRHDTAHRACPACTVEHPTTCNGDDPYQHTGHRGTYVQLSSGLAYPPAASLRAVLADEALLGENGLDRFPVVRSPQEGFPSGPRLPASAWTGRQRDPA